MTLQWYAYVFDVDLSFGGKQIQFLALWQLKYCMLTSTVYSGKMEKMRISCFSLDYSALTEIFEKIYFR